MTDRDLDGGGGQVVGSTGGGSGATEDGTVAAAVRAGDEAAFADLAERYRHELRVHCYRMLGSFDESEDLVQETFLRAWRRRDSFEGRSTFRSWLYRIATNACLDHLDKHPRRPVPRQLDTGSADSTGWAGSGGSTGTIRPARRARPPAEISWLQPYPDRLLEPVAPSGHEPDAAVVAKETIELAFLAAIQHLPPRQRATLILRDVLGWPARDTAELIDASVASVNSALQRARATLKEHLPPQRTEWAPSSDPTVEEQALLRRYMDASEQADAAAVAALLREDALLTMPPHPTWVLGRDAIVAFAERAFDPRSDRYLGRWRRLPAAANRQPAAAAYVRRPGDQIFRAQLLDVLRVENGQIVEITAFEPRHFPAFGLPMSLPGR